MFLQYVEDRRFAFKGVLESHFLVNKASLVLYPEYDLGNGLD